MASPLSLPRFVTLKSKYNNKYLRYIREEGELHTFVQFSGEEVVSPYTKFEVETAKCGDGLVHLRSCYNNRYWARKSEDDLWIVAGADEPVEDKSKWSCTLFKPVFVDGDATTVRLLHVQTGHYACLWRTVKPPYDCLFAGSEIPNSDLCDVCTVIDWESLMIIPKNVAFKGENGMYLSTRMFEGAQHLQFASTEAGDPSARYEIFINHDGSVRIKSHYSRKFWGRSTTNWILADSDETTSNNIDTLFWPVKVASNVVALRNLGNNQFCKRFTAGQMTSYLSAIDSTVSQFARIEVSEPISSRKIYNVDFRLLDARIYNQKDLTIATGDAVNKTQEAMIKEVKLFYAVTKSSTWASNVSLKLGVKTHINTCVPFSIQGKVDVSGEFNGAYEWGESKKLITEMETTCKVLVPEMTKVTVSLLVSTESCDVPFAYSQCDTLINGQQITYNMEDGIYTGINFFNYNYVFKEEKL